MPAGTGIHRREQLKTCRELGLPRGPRDDDAPRLERLAQRLQRRPREFGQLVEEEDPLVRERDLARPRRAGAAPPPPRPPPVHPPGPAPPHPTTPGATARDA